MWYDLKRKFKFFIVEFEFYLPFLCYYSYLDNRSGRVWFLISHSRKTLGLRLFDLVLWPVTIWFGFWSFGSWRFGLVSWLLELWIGFLGFLLKVFWSGLLTLNVLVRFFALRLLDFQILPETASIWLLKPSLYKNDVRMDCGLVLYIFYLSILYNFKIQSWLNKLI